MKIKISPLVIVKIKINLIQKKLLNHLNLRNKLINFSEFDEEYNKFMDNVVKFEYHKSEKEPGSVSPNQKEMRRYVKGLKDITDHYNLKSGSDTSKKGEGLKILTNKQMLILLPILLT